MFRPFDKLLIARSLKLGLAVLSISPLSAALDFNPGSNAWDTSTTNWMNGSTPVSWNNTTAETANFALGSTAVIQAGGVNAGYLNFSSNYTVSGGSLTLRSGGDSTVSVGAGMSTTVSAAVLNGFTKLGTGVLTLANSSPTNTGNVVVGAGTLRLGASNQIADTASLTVSSGATFDLNGFNETLVLGNDATATGTITATSAATLTINTTGAPGTFYGNFAGSLAFTDNNTSDITFLGSTASTNSGTANFSAATANTITFNKTSGANVFGGAITLFRGTIILQQSEQISNSGAVSIELGTGALLNLNNQNETIGQLASTGSGTSTAVSLGTGTLTFGGNGITSTFNGVITGSGGIVKAGGVMTTLGGNSTFTGGLTINSGIIAVASDSSLGASTGLLTVNTGTLQTTSSFTTGRPIVFGLSGATVLVNPSTTLTLNSSASIAGTSAWSKTGLGSLVLQTVSGNALGTGQFTLTGGNLQIAPSGSGNNVVLASANDLTSTRFFFGQGNTLFLNRGGNNSLTLTLGNSAATAPGTAASGVLARTGLATLVVAPTSIANLGASEKLVVNGGVFQVNGMINATVVGQNTATENSGDFLTHTAANGLMVATYTDTNFGAPTSASVENISANTTLSASQQVYALRIGDGTAGRTLNLNGNTLTLGNGVSTNAAGLILNAGASGSAALIGGTVAFGNSEGLIYAGGGAAGNTISSIITGTRGVTFFGPGTTTLSGANSYTGSTTVNSGTIILGANNALPSGTLLNLQPSLTTSFNLNNFNLTLANLTGSSNLALGSGILTVGDATSFSFSGVISGSGSLLKVGIGTMTLSTINSTYTGGTTVNAGTIRLSGSDRLPTTGALNLTTSSTTFDLGGNNSQTLSVLTGPGSVINTGSSTPNLTIGDNSVTPVTTDTALGVGSSNRSFGLIKAGTGTVILSAVNTYAGNTTVTGGTLRVGAASAIPVTTSLTVGATGGSNPATFDLNGYAVTVTGLSSGGTTGARIVQSSTAGASLTVNNSASMNFAGVIQNGVGSLPLTKQNSGTLTLSGANTFTGATVLSGGVLSVGSIGNGGVASGNLGSASNAASNLVFDGGTLRFSGGSSSTDRNFTINSGVAATIDVSTTATILTASGSSSSSTGSLVKIGTGALILSGDNGYTGGTTLTAGTLTVGSSGALGSAGTIGFGGGTLQFSAANSTDYSSRFSNAVNQSYRLDTNSQNVALATALTSTGGTLTKLGAGILTLTGNNTYTGLTDIQAGTLSLGRVGGSIANTAAVQVNGSTLDVANSDTVGAVTVITGTISGPGTLTGSAFNLTNSATLSANLAGTGGFNKSGAGTATVSGANTNTGATTISAGILSVGSIGNGGVSSSNLGSASSVASNLVLNGGTLLYTGSGESTNRNFTLGTNGGTFDGSGSGAIIFAGTPTINGTNTARTLNLTGTNTGANTLNGVLSDNGIGLTSLSKTGTGSWTLSGASTYTGVTTISGGTLNVGSIGNGGVVSSNLGSATGGASNLILNGGTLRYTGNGETTDRNFTVGISGTTFDASGSAAISFSGSPTLSGTNTARTLSLAGTNLGNNIFGGIITNNGTGLTSLTKSGVGLWNLTGSNTYSGITTINGGTLSVGTIGNGGSISSNLGSASSVAANLVLNGSVLQYLGGGETTDRNFTVGTSGGTLDASGTAAVTLSGSPTLSGTNIARTFILTGTNTASNTFSGVLSNNGSGASALTKTGSGTWVLSGNNAYTGPTTIRAGILSTSALASIGINSNIGPGVSTSNATNAASLVLDGGTLRYTGSTVTSSRLFTLTQNGGSIDASGSANAALILNTASAIAFAGSGSRQLNLTGSSAGANTLAPILGDGSGGSTSLTKSGSGTWILSSANTYTGNTNIDAGTLFLTSTGSLISSAVLNVGGAGSSGAVLDVTGKTSFAIVSGQTLKGIGTVNLGSGKTATINGRLAPGNSIGTNSVTGNLALTGTADFELGSPGTRIAPGASDRTAVTGSLTLGGALNLIDNGGANGSAGAGSYLIFTQTGTAAGTFATVNNLAGYRARVDTATAGSVFLDNYLLATSSATQTVNVGNTRTGTAKSTAVFLTNTSLVNTTYTETLSSGTFVGTTTGFTTAGAALGIAGGSASSGTLSVGLATGLSAGSYTGTTTLGLNSNAVNGSGFAATSAGSQVITINGAVYDLASPTVNTAGPLNFGNIHVASGTVTANVSITNSTISNAAYQDSLNASASSSNTQVAGTGFSALTASNTGNVIISADISTVGSLASTVTLGFVSNANGVGGLSNTTLTDGTIATTGYVYSGQGVWNDDGNGSWADISKWTANGGSPGLDAGFTNTDTATFGSAATSGNPIVNLNGVSPSLKAITFNNSSHSYTIAPGTGGTIILNNGGGIAGITNSSGSHEISAPVLLAGNTRVNVIQSSDALSISGAISGTRNLEKTGLGVLILSGANSNSGGTTISAGTIQGDTSSLRGAIINNGNLVFNQGNTGNFSGNITGIGALTKISSGTVSLTSTNIFTGATVIDGGKLNAGAANALSNTSLISVNNSGTLEASASSSISATGGIVVHAGGTLLLSTAGLTNRIANTAGIVLDGGQLVRGSGVTEGVAGTSGGISSVTGLGILTLSANSQVDFGSGTVGSLIFAGLATEGFTLTIDNWTGVQEIEGINGSSDRLIVAADLTLSQLANITFTGYGNGASKIELTNGYYEIVAVPEPSTLGAILIGCGSLFLFRRRRH